MIATPRLPDAVSSLPEAVAFWAERTPDATAIVVPDSAVITYADLWRRTGALAEWLVEAGTRREDRVVLFLPEGVALVDALLATMLAGIAVPLPVTLAASELDQALHGLRATAALVAPGIAPAVRECFVRHAVPVLELSEPAPLAGRGTALCWPRAEALAIVRQTSGTTGRPKRIPCLHGALVANGRRQRDQLALGPHDRAPAVSALTVTLGQTVLAHTIVTGGALIIPPRGDVAESWRAIARERPTWMSTSAGYLELLARSFGDHPPPSTPSSLRFVQVTSAPIAPDTRRLLERLLGAPILPRYSSTEAGGVAMTLPPPARAKPGSVGQPVQEVRIVGLAGKDVVPGREGEIWVRGPRVMSGYLDDPEATAAVLLPGGWYRTGDVGFLDEDRFLFLTGRLNDLINRGGEKIAPAEVDAVLQSHPAIAEAATFAVPDARLGEDIVAAVVLREGVTIRPWEVRAWLLQRLSPAKAPRRFWMVERLPRTATGKVRRGALRDQFLNRQAPNSD